MITAITMFDDVNVSLLPKNAPAYAGYVDGRFQTFPVLEKMFPKATLLSIAVFPQDDADCLDVETGDATIADIFGWFERQQARKVWRPVVYSSVSNMDHIFATMTANGFRRSSYRLWSAHYGAGQHICGPSSCGLCQEPCDGTQWTSTALGESLDQSLLLDGFFPSPNGPVLHRTDGKQTIGDYAHAIGMRALGFAEMQGRLNEADAQAFLRDAVPPAGRAYYTP